jgi:short-subunit dehydrogenase
MTEATIKETSMKTAIIVGASSGIGRALAKTLAADGYAIGLVARRENLLLDLQHEIGTHCIIKQFDISDTDRTTQVFNELVQQLGGVDLVINSAGVGFLNPELDWEKERQTIAVNVTGFTAFVNATMHHFMAKGSGHLVNISSIGALRGNGIGPAYNASKAFESLYLDGLRHRVTKLRLPITVTDIQPGFVDTAMAQGGTLFWVASPEKAAKQIYEAIKKKRKHAYVTRRWRIFAWFLRLAPDWIYYRF